MNRESLRNLFDACDADGSGYIGLDEVRSICAKFQIGVEDADLIFQDLDCDGDGQISFDDFCAGFFEYENANKTKPERVINGRRLSECFALGMNDGSVTKKRQDNICQIDSSALIEPIESQEIISELLEKFKKLQEENNRLTQSWLREKRDHEVHLHQIEQDLDSQVKEVENRVRQHAKEEIEADRRQFREMVQEEMSELQAHLSMFEKVDAWLKSNASNNHAQEDKMNELRDELQQTLQENRQMRNALLETQAMVTMIFSDLAEMRNQQNSKDVSKERMKQYESDEKEERLQLGKQLQVLQDANKRLKDAHDTLRSSIDADRVNEVETMYAANYDKRQHRGSIIGDYLKLSDSATKRHQDMAVAEKLHSSVLETSPIVPYMYNKEIAQAALSVNSDDGPDSGVSSNVREELFENDCLSGPYSTTTTFTLNNNNYGERQVKEASTRKNEEIPTLSTKGNEAGKLLDKNFNLMVAEADGPPERAFHVIFIGDANVGKTAFISRIVKNVFINELSATVGIDFQVRTLNVNGRNVTLQLWDTAGQERYRSITKSYFRKADGIILVYDVTQESSFLSVREWMNAVEDVSGNTVPVVLVGNKIDLRSEDKSGFVKKSSGEKISEQYKIPFLETSVKDGFNVLNSAGELTRLMLENEQKLIRGITLSKSEKKFKCCN